MKLGSKPNESGRGEKKWLVPTDSYQKGQIRRVIKRASLELKNYDIDIDSDNFKLYTIAVFYAEATLRYLNTKYEKTRGVDVSLGNLINFGLSVREVQDAEKTGNINAVVSLGAGGKYIVENIRDFVDIKNVDEPLELISPESQDELIDIEQIQAIAVRNLLSYEIFLRPDDMSLYTSMMIFLKSAIVITVMEAVTNGSSIVNIGEMFSINGIVDDTELIVNCVPGADGKLLVKSDGATEDE